jgi:hypothetical protein
MNREISDEEREGEKRKEKKERGVRKESLKNE